MTGNNPVKIYKPDGGESLQAVILTDNAMSYLQKHIKRRGAGNGLRLSIKRSGCSGYSYVLQDVDEIIASDYVFPIDDQLAVYVDKDSYPMVKGTCIDYVIDGLNGRYVFRNPQESVVCGCGESFSVVAPEDESSESI